MRCFLPALAASVLVTARAESNIDPLHSLSSSDLIGTIEWRPAPETGAVVNPYFCAGFIYGASVGWMNLGTGAPANGLSYQNDSAADFGVNVSPAGDLSGFAYGANIGWINFAAAGKPHVDWATGQLSGSAWSANAGWIPLTGGAQYLRIESLPEMPDSDGDGLPDAWEIQMTGNLNVLSANADADFDGASDLDEYRAGTNPLDENDFVGPLTLTLQTAGNDLRFPTKRDHLYRIEQHGPFGSGIWSPAPVDPILGTGDPAVVHLDSSPGELFFYRLVAYPPLTQLE